MRTSCAVLLVSLLSILVAAAQAQEDFEYTTNFDGVTGSITGYTGGGGAVVIPTNIQGLTIVNIATNAFYLNSNVTSLTIPGTVTNIAADAFEGCTSLTNAFINNGLTGIGASAFANCTNLLGVMMPNSLTSIASGAFANCLNLTSATIPGGVANIGSYAFEYCAKLTNAMIENGVRSIGQDAFYDCPGLVSVTLAASVTNIGFWAFESCTNLKSVYCLGNAPTVGTVVFGPYDKAIIYYLAGTAGWTSPFAGVTSALWNPFYGSTNAGAITITSYAGPGGAVIIPSTVNGLPVTSIGANAFENFSSITSLTIPNTVTNIGAGAFSGCTNLTSVYFNGNPPAADPSIFGSQANLVVYALAGTTGWASTFAGFEVVNWVPSYELGLTSFLVGPGAGSNSVTLAVNPNNAAWTAVPDASWLRATLANQTGTGSTNVMFNYDANPGTTRSGTLEISGQALTVTQVGSTYVYAAPLTTLVSSNLDFPSGVAVDAAGNVYIADTDHNAVKEWTVANNTLTTLVSSNLSSPQSVAVDGAGNVYIADYGHNAIKLWTPTDSKVTSLVSSGLNEPTGVAVDSLGNLYIAEAWNGVILEWSALSSNLTTLVPSGLMIAGNEGAWGLAVDIAGNLFIADTQPNALKEWVAADEVLSTLVPSGLGNPPGVAVDGSGNVYVAAAGNNAIIKWTAATKSATTLVSAGLSYPNGVAVDSAGNIYIVNESPSFGLWTVKELPYAFVDPTPISETAAAGTDALPVVLPATENLLPPFAPISNGTNWLTITSVTNGVVSFAFTANTGPSRTAHITLLGQTIPVTQGVIGTPPNLTSVQMLANGSVRFAFSNNPSASFTVLSTSNLALPLSDWTVIGSATNMGSGLFQFTSQPVENAPQLYYAVRSP